MIPALFLAIALVFPAALSGTVHSADHRPISSAVVTVQQGGRTHTARVDDQGAFTLNDVALPVMVEVQAPGFTTARVFVETSPATFILVPSSIRESIVVQSSLPEDIWRRPTTGTTVLSGSTIATLPAQTFDEALHVISGLSLFRRSSSRASNPTTHGVTMRGLSASGSSRGLVLLDGVPLNDGFGGWVTWTRVPVLAVSQVAVDRGAEGATFGSDALGGVIDFTIRAGDRLTGAAGAQGGSEGLASVDVSSGGQAGRLSWFGAASWYQSDGVIPVAPESRGAVDSPADAEWTNGLGKLSLTGAHHRLTVEGWGGSDDRGNGTVIQRNHINGGTAAVSYNGVVRSMNMAARVAYSPNEFMQTFSTVAAGRAMETLNSTQFIDTTTTRALGEIGRAIPRGYITGRVSMTRAQADFTEDRPTSHTVMQLKDNSEAVALHAAWNPLARLSFGAGAREEWRTAPNAAGDADRATVGHASAAWRVSDTVTIRGSAATSHRWPTLNELVRNFQVGSVLTQANPDLAPERATSGDVALAFTARHWNGSVAGFWTSVAGAIANVTIQSTPTIIRQRRNTGIAEARGLELDAEARLTSFSNLRLSALLVDATFHDSLEPALEGNRLPQVPRSSVSLSGDIRVCEWLKAAAIYRWIAPQFDDDRNVFELASASQFDVRLFGSVRGFTWHLTVENATGERIEVGKTPLVTLAPGRAIRAGLTWRK